MQFAVVVLAATALAVAVGGASARVDVASLDDADIQAQQESLPGLEEFAQAQIDYAQKQAEKAKKAAEANNTTRSRTSKPHHAWTKSSTCPGDEEGFCVVKFGNRQYEMVHCQHIHKNTCTRADDGTKVKCTKAPHRRKLVCLEEDNVHAAMRKKHRVALAARRKEHKCVSDNALREADPSRGGACMTPAGKHSACKSFDEYFTKCHLRNGKKQSCDCVTIAYKHAETHKCLPPEKMAKADPKRGGVCGAGPNNQALIKCKSFNSQMTKCVQESGHAAICKCVVRAYRPRGPPRKCMSHFRILHLADPSRGGYCRVNGRDERCDGFTRDFRWCINHEHHGDRKCQCVSKAYRKHKHHPDENYLAYLREKRRNARRG
jgi:hypothetical protein